jgi:hypothetical protein
LIKMGLKEYFLGTETAECIRQSSQRTREILSTMGETTESSSPFGEGFTRKYIRGEMLLGKYIPNITTTGSLLVSAVSGEPSWLWGIAWGEGFRVSYDAMILRLHRKNARENF